MHLIDFSAVYDPGGERGRSLDRGGHVNLLTWRRMSIERWDGRAAVSCLAQVGAWRDGGTVQPAGRRRAKKPR